MMTLNKGISLALFTATLLSVVLTACTPKAPVAGNGDGEVIDVSLEQIGAGAAVCVGEFILAGGKLDVDVEAQAGGGLFVGLHSDDSVTTYAGVTWDLLIDGSLPFTGDQQSVKASNGVSDWSGTYYVYVGSAGEALSAVSGAVTYQRQ